MRSKRKGTLFFIITGLLYGFGFLFFWLIRKWKSPSINQLMVTFLTPQVGTDSATKVAGLMNFLIPVVLVVALIVVFNRHGKEKVLTIICRIGLVFFLVELILVCLNFKLFPSQRKNTKLFSDIIEDEIRETKTKNISFPWKKRNLIVLFLESMELTYSDGKAGGAFDENLIPNLTEIAQKNICFSKDGKTLNGGIVLPCCDNTISGIFAQTSSIPLKINSENDEIEKGINFFEGLTNLGDILEKHNYTKLFVCGSDARFSGTDLLLRQHGNYLIKDYVYAKDNGLIPEDYRVWWGYEDEKLFSFVKNELLQLQKRNKPFNLMLKTVDTHKEDGFVCRLCEEKHEDNRYADVISCSDRQVSDFLRWCREQDFYDNTTIVVLGDHLTMDSDFCEDVPEEYVRKTYVSIINPHKKINQEKFRKTLTVKDERMFSTFDLFPTILSSIGCKVKGDRLGLGVNLFSDEKTLIEKYGIEVLSQEIEKRSEYISNLQKREF